MCTLTPFYTSCKYYFLTGGKGKGFHFASMFLLTNPNIMQGKETDR